MSRVWVYPERVYEELGAVRYRATWEEVRPGAMEKDDIDPDMDIIHRFANYKTKEPALRKARELVDSRTTAYGSARVIRQIVDWFVEEDRVAEWVNTMDEEVID